MNMTHMHITSWVIALILVFVAYGLYSSGNSKGAKITHMILRLFYIIVIITGAQALFKVHGMERRIHSEGLARPHHHRIHGNAINPQEKRKSGHWDLDRLYCRSALDGCAWTPASAGL